MPSAPCGLTMTDLHEEIQRLKEVSDPGWFSRWSPLLFSLVANAVLFGIFYGQTRADVQHLKDSDVLLRSEIVPLEKSLAVFTTRTEFDSSTKARDVETAEIRKALTELNNKIDRLIERTYVSGKSP